MLRQCYVLPRILSRPRTQISTTFHRIKWLQPAPLPSLALPILDADANHVKHALQGVAHDPESERHAWRLVQAEDHDSCSDYHEGEVPDDVKDHHGFRVRPVTLPLLQLLRRGLAHQHWRLAHHPVAAAGLPQKPSCLAQALPLNKSTARICLVAWPARIDEQRRRIDDVGPWGGTVGGPCRSH